MKYGRRSRAVINVAKSPSSRRHTRRAGTGDRCRRRRRRIIELYWHNSAERRHLHRACLLVERRLVGNDAAAAGAVFNECLQSVETDFSRGETTM